ncbi:tetratricopeptide repeat protein [Albibacterium bauzanense]|uniref:Tetratricopeptide repeat protein n=1 Tax=Albibacterium bauzanense TaxID=653929 RepID=A0A4R1LU08_9SPHI|nr:tetratricopeptide repeat protein [Albibacterium bauzanense]TCK80623.1 tetratricopeptide repeat protein [Albibacterium bauzanense]
MIKKSLFIICFLLFSSLFAKANFDFNYNCRQAYDAIFDLRMNEAKKWIATEKSQNANNGIIVLLENYIDFFSLLASENKSDYERLKARKSSRLSALERNDKNSPFYFYSQAEINLQWGLLQSRFQDYFPSAMDIWKAEKLLRSNAERFPDFSPNKKSSGLIDVIFGAIPANLQRFTSTLGLKGNVTRGIKTLEGLLTTMPKSYDFYKKEVAFFLCYIETDLVPHQSGYNKMISYTESFNDSSLLKSYLQGYVSMKYYQNDKAIAYLQGRPKGSAYIAFPSLDYLLGIAKLNRMDADANIYLANFINNTEGVNYVKDAYLKLSYYYYLRGNNTRYREFLQSVKTKGNNYDEKDKQALKEANDAAPDPSLLSARFFFDGGYYNRALEQLKTKNTNSFKLQRDKIEFHYRLGRIYDESGQDPKALSHYQQAIDLGKQTSYYYAANAALNIGDIYENQNNKKQAAAFYRMAIAMKNHEYESSIENKAKSALKRIGN